MHKCPDSKLQPRALLIERHKVLEDRPWVIDEAADSKALADRALVGPATAEVHIRASNPRTSRGIACSKPFARGRALGRVDESARDHAPRRVRLPVAGHPSDVDPDLLELAYAELAHVIRPPASG